MNIQPAKILVASILASVVIFFWGFVFWTLIPSPGFGHKSIPRENLGDVTQSLAKLERGTYLNPGMVPYEGETMEDWQRRHESESVFIISLHPGGTDVMPPITFVQALVHGFAAAVIIGVLLSMTAHSFCCYSHRVFFVAMLGLFETIWVDAGESIWWMRTCGLTVWHSVYHIVAWTLAGLVMAAIVTPAKSTENSK